MYQRLGMLALATVLAGCQQDGGPSTNSGGSVRQPSYVEAPPPPPPVHLSSPNARPSPYTGTGKSYPPGQYYRPSTVNSVPREWIPSGTRHDWNYIVIHHSDTKEGSAEAFRKYHVEQRHWADLGYHFVIGNGAGAPDGAVQVGGRWTRQEIGAHAGVLKYNEEGIGICLVGNFDEGRPSAAQMQSVAKLTAYLMRTYHIPSERVIGHNQAKSGRTDCPGRYFSVASLRGMASRYVHADDPSFPVFETLAQVDLNAPQSAGELLRDVSHQ